MNAERHSECKRACRMPAPVLYAVCSREGQPGHWVVGPFRNGSEHTEWVGAFRTVYAFLDGSLNFLDWSLETGPSLRPVVCLSSESQYEYMGICRWIVRSQTGARLEHPVLARSWVGHSHGCSHPAVCQVWCAPTFMCAGGGGAGGVGVGTRWPSRRPKDGGSGFGLRETSGMHRPSKN